MTEKLGIAAGKVPYAGRHTYADKLKEADGSDKDKASLIGHSNYLFTQNHYQSSHLKDLYELVNSIPSKADEST
jgi:integrase